jgi:hypothetical protein
MQSCGSQKCWFVLGGSGHKPSTPTHGRGLTVAGPGPLVSGTSSDGECSVWWGALPQPRGITQVCANVKVKLTGKICAF